LELRLKDALVEKDESLKQITMLNEELKLQEEYFKKELKENLEHASNLA